MSRRQPIGIQCRALVRLYDQAITLALIVPEKALVRRDGRSHSIEVADSEGSRRFSGASQRGTGFSERESRVHDGLFSSGNAPGCD
jgi:hypothetical protein